ncbi:hypothetical protein FHL15_000098 [Xylaria flabelliformis]|uniref:Uncharacterized protein n=1 Tax=Xylaria flabelliformis TaxID=2512241 RepID=A0A553IF08_9PEZI|nr:hypothetical protein FHL15_000098 [Xylaria flabelliformis]
MELLQEYLTPDCLNLVPVARPSVQSTAKLVSLGPSHTSIDGYRKSKVLIPARIRMTGPTTLSKNQTRVDYEADS